MPQGTGRSGFDYGTLSELWENSLLSNNDVNCEEVLLGLGTEYRSEKIPRNRLGTVSVIPRKKVLIPRHSEFRGRANSEARNGAELARKWSRQSTYIAIGI